MTRRMPDKKARKGEKFSKEGFSEENLKMIALLQRRSYIHTDNQITGKQITGDYQEITKQNENEKERRI